MDLRSVNAPNYIGESISVIKLGLHPVCLALIGQSNVVRNLTKECFCNSSHSSADCRLISSYQVTTYILKTATGVISEHLTIEVTMNPTYLRC